MKATRIRLDSPILKAPCSQLSALLLLLLLVMSTPAAAQERPKFKVTQRTAGGLDPRPAITSVKAKDGVQLEWVGIGKKFKVERCPDLNAPWKELGSVAGFNYNAAVDGPIGFFRVTGEPPNYTGATTCADCHEEKVNAWSNTAHAKAFETLKALKQETNPRCVACHSVGASYSTGFIDEKSTPFLAGVQCESCHGPAGDHANNPTDLSLRPVITLSAKVCGGCHTDFHHPTYDEWETTGHSKVTPTPAAYFKQYGEPRIRSCGACHSGSGRMALVKNTKLPSGEEAAEFGITCAVCHDPHANTPHGRQLRNPTSSLQNFSYNTSTNTTFAAQYDANLNLCGQCHNSRGATWKDAGRYPHYSPQYNVLVGKGGIDEASAPQGKHREIQKQCTHCHTHPHPVENPSEENPVFTGHNFKPQFGACLDCHNDGNAATLVENTQKEIKDRIVAVKALLDSWGATKAPEALRAKYGALAWEYNTPGGLSNPESNPKIVGPTASEQTVVPENIKQARYNVYLVKQDGSYGVHNGKYSRHLLDVAEKKVKAELETAVAAGGPGGQ